MKFKLSTIGLSLLAASSLAGVAQAQTAASAAPGAMQAGAGGMTDGEVRKVDKEAGKLTLKHADIKSLDMPGMTMVFEVKDKTMLDKVQPGDKVKFKAVNEAGKFTVTEIQPAK